ncbi:MmgE/PrpD family protein [Pseudonocardia xishanensis]|uniref:2-methylcitrate dehydratase PrpD n=1 Tax=Pseudonocardia xishanensis TaxID=630995 RepID=A0ABP8RXS5_9PSEU
MGATRELGEFVADGRVDSPRAVEQTVRAFLDCAGVTLLGADEASASAVRRMAMSQAAVPGPAAVLGRGGLRMGAIAAAEVNGTAAHALDYDDIGLRIGHPTAVVMSAALAVAEHVGGTGRDLVESMIVGYEVAHRFAALSPDNLAGPYARGYHGTPVYGIFGAAAAAARLLRLDPDRVGHALGIAASTSSGLRANFGTMTKPYHAGAAAAGGVRAAFLASEGMTAAHDALERRYGWTDVIGGVWPEGGDRLTAGLGTRPPAIEGGLWFKAFPCCGANQYAIDGVVELMRRHGLDAADVAAVDVTVDAKYLDEVLVYPWPESGLQAKFSLAYNVVAAVMDGAITPASYTDEAVERHGTARSLARTHGTRTGARHDAVVVLTTADGRLLRSVTGDPGEESEEPVRRTLHGIEADPLTWDELAAKFSANAETVMPPEAVADALDALSTLADQPSLTAVTTLLQPTAPAVDRPRERVS